ncbi:MAG: transporter substrate-binding domain-containing protein [Selenomonadaceae bacterium]|nr:transporter substrate-binding domain-containing protein [Selenomonadaceae bacterium]
MRKIFLLLLMILTVSGCGSSEDKPQPVKVGTLTQLNTSPEQASKLVEGSELNFYDNFNSMQMALSAGNINSIQTYGSVAKYMTANNTDYKIDEGQTVSLVDDFCCAMREDDVDLRNAFNAAIEAMKADGTLDALIDKYVTHFNENPIAVEIVHIDGAETIRVGITGDLPMLDFVLADGKPVGFNTAVLAEISKRIGKNIELVQIESAARAAALTSGHVDVVFWVVVPADDSNRPKDFDKPEGVAVTDPYYQDVVVNVNLSSLSAGF